jgi:hypothetical protein
VPPGTVRAWAAVGRTSAPQPKDLASTWWGIPNTPSPAAASPTARSSGADESPAAVVMRATGKLEADSAALRGTELVEVSIQRVHAHRVAPAQCQRALVGVERVHTALRSIPGNPPAPPPGGETTRPRPIAVLQNGLIVSHNSDTTPTPPSSTGSPLSTVVESPTHIDRPLGPSRDQAKPPQAGPCPSQVDTPIGKPVRRASLRLTLRPR